MTTTQSQIIIQDTIDHGNVTPTDILDFIENKYDMRYHRKQLWKEIQEKLNHAI